MMMSISFKDKVIFELRNQNINEFDVLMVESFQSIAEATMKPKVYAQIKMTDGSQHRLDLKLTTEEILDLNANSHVVIEDDINDLNRYFKRQISLNDLLGYE